MSKNKVLFLRLLASLAVTLSISFCNANETLASTIKLIVDGEDITNVTEPRIVNDRTLVPIRAVSEKLGAEVIWNNDERTVEIIKGDRKMLLRIDSYLTEYNMDSVTSYNLSDVQAQIFNSRTFVPLRLVSNGLGVSIEWDNNTRTVRVDSSKSSDIETFFDFKISSVKKGQVITGTTNLQSVFSNSTNQEAAEIKYLLLSPENAKGFVIARGNDISSSYEWKPRIEDNGQKILVAAIYDSKGKFVAGDAVNVNVIVESKIKLKGITENEAVNTSKKLSADLNFSPEYIVYEMKNAITQETVYTSPKWDPVGDFTMVPYVEDNDGLSIRAVAYDSAGNAYYSDYITVSVNVAPEYFLKGVTNYQTIENKVVLRASTNFNATQIEYVMRDSLTKEDIILKTVSSGSFEWNPTIEYGGNKELYVRIKDASNNTYISDPVYVTVSKEPKILMTGAGPNQVITGVIDLRVLSNVTLNNVKFIIKNSASNREYIIAEGNDSNAVYAFNPADAHAGSWKLRAEGVYGSQKLITEEVPITVYLGTIYGAKPVIEKDKFLDMASGLAVDTWKNTGMSAALQTAQAILETGWGQSVPVDKYTGQFSYNLFGIKGEGTKGSVTSNTWEEYNGVSYRIDDEFRAYNSVQESWDDHNILLLTKERYGIYRDVMHDSTAGAWALRRAGYATDSSYPIKLMEIIRRYDLKKLDETGI